MNKLIIVADASHARVYRVARPADPSAPDELIAVDSIHDDAADRADHEAAATHEFAEQVALRVTRFALHHVCNPVVVAAPPGTCERLLAELEHRLPDTYIRAIHRDVMALKPAELLGVLEHSFTRPEPGNAPVP